MAALSSGVWSSYAAQLCHADQMTDLEAPSWAPCPQSGECDFGVLNARAECARGFAAGRKGRGKTEDAPKAAWRNWRSRCWGTGSAAERSVHSRF